MSTDKRIYHHGDRVRDLSDGKEGTVWADNPGKNVLVCWDGQVNGDFVMHDILERVPLTLGQQWILGLRHR